MIADSELFLGVYSMSLPRLQLRNFVYLRHFEYGLINGHSAHLISSASGQAPPRSLARSQIRHILSPQPCPSKLALTSNPVFQSGEKRLRTFNSTLRSCDSVVSVLRAWGINGESSGAKVAQPRTHRFPSKLTW
jgi:hypothetical protein